jgi:hypothetical protein
LNKKASYIVSHYFLIASLLFGQVAVNFLHSKHDAHERVILLPDGQHGVQKHGEHCKVCSLDILFNLLFQASTPISPLPFQGALVPKLELNVKFLRVSLSQGRAPPVSIS